MVSIPYLIYRICYGKNKLEATRNFEFVDILAERVTRPWKWAHNTPRINTFSLFASLIALNIANDLIFRLYKQTAPPPAVSIFSRQVSVFEWMANDEWWATMIQKCLCISRTTALKALHWVCMTRQKRNRKFFENWLFTSRQQLSQFLNLNFNNWNMNCWVVHGMDCRQAVKYSRAMRAQNMVSKRNFL